MAANCGSTMFHPMAHTLNYPPPPSIPTGTVPRSQTPEVPGVRRPLPIKVTCSRSTAAEHLYDRVSLQKAHIGHAKPSLCPTHI